MAHEIDGMTIGKNRDVEMITGANGKTNAAFPERVWVRKADVRVKVAEYEQIVEMAREEDKDAFQKVLDKWNEKLLTIELLGGDYKELPTSALSLCRTIITLLTTHICRFRMNFNLQLMS